MTVLLFWMTCLEMWQNEVHIQEHRAFLLKQKCDWPVYSAATGTMVNIRRVCTPFEMGQGK